MSQSLQSRAPRSRVAARSAISTGALCRGEVGAELDELLAEPGDLPRLVEERRAVEHPGDELAHAGEELEVAAPVPLGVVVEVHQADELPAGDQGHRERAGEAPRAHDLGLVGAEPIVAEVGDRQRRVVEECALQRGIAARCRGSCRAGSGSAPSRVQLTTMRITPPPARHTSTQSAFAAVSSRCAKCRTNRSKSCVCATSRERSTISRTLLSRCASSSTVRLIATASAHTRARPPSTSACCEKSRSPASLSSIAPTNSPRSTSGAQARERQPRRCIASRARRLRPLSVARRQVTASGRRVAVGGRPLGGDPRRAEAGGVELAAVDRDGEPQPVAVGEEDVAARRSGDAAHDASRLGRHRMGVVGQQRHEVEPGLQREAQVLCLTAQMREVAGGGPLALVLRQEREHVVGEIAAVAAGAAMGGDTADVRPAAHGVRAHAELLRDVSDAKPDRVWPLSHGSHSSPSTAPAGPPLIGTIRIKLDQNSHAVHRLRGGSAG